MNTIEKGHALLARLLMLVLVVFMLLIGLRFGTRYILINRLGMNNAFTRLVMWEDRRLSIPGPIGDERAEVTDWDERYPFSVPAAQTTRWAHRFRWIDELQGWMKSRVGRISTAIDLYANQHLMFRQPIVESANRYERLIGWNLAGYSEYNNVVDLGEGYLTTFNGRIDVDGNAAAIGDLRGFLDSRGIPLLFVQLPNKISRQDGGFNDVVDFYNDNANRLVEGIRSRGVSALDLRDHAEQQYPETYHALFFNSDHHWLPQTGLWAAGEIAQVLNGSFGYAIDLAVLKPENYTQTVYEDWFLGSLGKKVTLARAKPDDLVTLHPIFPVELRLQIESLGLDATGGFDIIYDQSQLEYKDYYNQNTYGAYLYSAYSTHAFIRLENNLLPKQGKRMLLLGDSFSSTLAPFLSLGLEALDFVDLRSFNGSLQALVDWGGYDMVVVAYSSMFPVEYDSHKSMYDFR